MNFEYYRTFGLQLVLDLVNTRSEPAGEDLLSDAAGLTAFLAGRATVASRQAGRRAGGSKQGPLNALYHEARAAWAPTEADARAVRGLRTQLRTVFDIAACKPSAAMVVLNEQLRTHRALPRISDRHGAPHLHFEAAADGVVHWLAVTVLMALVLFVCDGNVSRLGICASASCRRAFVDRTRNGSKAYCSTTCAHRESVSAFRARLRDRQRNARRRH